MMLRIFSTAVLFAVARALVTVDIFYESLCPYCKRFIAEQLVPVMQSELAQHMEVRMYPYGNVDVQADGTLRCQHGEPECKLNAYHACALYYYQDVSVINFIACTEAEGQDSVEKCARSHFGPEGVVNLQQCYSGPLKNQLMNEIRSQSERASYGYVPWIRINDVKSTLAQTNLAGAVCSQLPEKPAACSTLGFRALSPSAGN